MYFSSCFSLLPSVSTPPSKEVSLHWWVWKTFHGLVQLIHCINFEILIHFQNIHLRWYFEISWRMFNFIVLLFYYFLTKCKSIKELMNIQMKLKYAFYVYYRFDSRNYFWYAWAWYLTLELSVCTIHVYCLHKIIATTIQINNNRSSQYETYRESTDNCTD